MSSHACTACHGRVLSECWQLQELVKVGCDVRYLNDSYRLNGLKATAAQQVSLSPTMRRMSAFQLCRPRSSNRNRTAERSFSTWLNGRPRRMTRMLNNS